MTRQLTDKYYIAIILLLFSLSISAQTIDNFEINGNSKFSDDEYFEWCKLNNSFFSGITDTIKNRVSSKLKLAGFYNYSLDSIVTRFSPDSQSVSIKLYLDEGDETYINNIYYTNLDSVETEITDREFFLLKNSTFIISDFEYSLSKLLTYFENNGFPFASIKIESLFFFHDSTQEQNFVDIYLNFEKNSISKIDTIEVEGNTKTKNYVIIRELRISEDEPYSQEKIEGIANKINRLHFFEPVSNPKYYFNSKDNGVLQINVVEKNTNHFDGIVGYIPSTNETEQGYFTGLVNVNLRNLFGTGRAVSFKWNKLDRYSQELELKYLEPWILGLPFNIDFRIYQRQQDTSYVQRSLNANITFLATESFSSSLTFSQEYTIPTNSIDNKFTVFNSVATNSGINFIYDSRDDIFVPTKGIYILSGFKYSSKNILGPDEYITESTDINPKQFKAELDLLIFKSIYNRHIPFIGLHFKELQGDNIEQSDLYRIGGNNTLRGYQEDQFLGNRLLWTNLEYRYLIEKRSYAFIFTDIAYYSRKNIDSESLNNFSATKIGYGMGITFETGLGMIAVSYALAKGDSFNRGKIHFGLIGEF